MRNDIFEIIVHFHCTLIQVIDFIQCSVILGFEINYSFSGPLGIQCFLRLHFTTRPWAGLISFYDADDW